jgi:hypothetical protein
MASGSSLIGLVLSVVYIGLGITFAVFADRLFKSRPIGLWGDVAAASIAVGAFAVFLGNGWHRLLLELNDAYPDYFAVAYVPVVAFVAVAFVRSLVPLISASAVQPSSAMAMAVSGPDVSGTSFDNNARSSVAPPPETARADAPAKPQSRLMKWLQLTVGVVLLAVIVLVGLARFITRNDLPVCNSQTARDILSNIFQSKKLEVKRYDDIRTTATTDAMISCTAFMTMMDDHRAEIDYQITFIEDQKVQVQITSARDK